MKHTLLSTALLLVLASCGRESSSGVETKANGKPQVLVANYPLKYFAERIGGSAVDVVFPAPGDEDPAFWQPDDAAVAKFQSADVILMNGATYSKWAEKVTLPQSKLVDTSAGFKAQYIEIKADSTHSHGPGGEHSHSGTAFTTWIDLTQAIQQAETVKTALAKFAPEAEANFAKLKTELEALDARLVAVGKRIANAPLVASHPVYHYFARRYALNLQSVLWEGEPAKESVAKLDAIGVKSVVVDPCGNVPDAGDFIRVMTANVEALEKAFP